MARLKVKLLATLKGEELNVAGAEFIGTIDELPSDIAEAVEEKADYIQVTEIPDEIPVKEVHVVKKEEAPAVTASTDAAKSSEIKSEGETTPEPKKTVPSKPVRSKAAPKKSALKPKE